MKFYVTLLAISLYTFCSAQKSTIQIPANEVIETDFPNYAYYKATINKKGLSDIDVAVLSKDANTQIKGFGLGTGSADIYVESENKLVLKNNSNSTSTVSIDIAEAERPSELKLKKYVSFTLRNTTVKSIPLIIPSVMNPNLSPMSNSGVDLKFGQEILFRKNGKKYLLLVVDDSIKNGDVLDVADLLEKRKQELGI